jgi:archaemetzincin
LARKRPHKGNKAHIYIVPLGEVPPVAASIVAANIETVVGLNAEVLPPFPSPEYAYVTLRSQYSAGKILNALESVADDGVLKLGLVQCDLCTVILKFVYGESQLGGKTAVVSLCRLMSRDPAETYLRAAKIAIHETGHLLGIGHCHAPDCLMVFASSLEKLDSLPLRFCPACRYEIARSLKCYLEGI